MLVMRQPDGTLAQIPAWMCAPAAAAMAVREHPRIALTALRDLRLAVDAALSSLSDTIGGERHGASADCTTRRFPGAGCAFRSHPIADSDLTRSAIPI
jgi:hypothetical protein